MWRQRGWGSRKLCGGGWRCRSMELPAEVVTFAAAEVPEGERAVESSKQVLGVPQEPGPPRGCIFHTHYLRMQWVHKAVPQRAACTSPGTGFFQVVSSDTGKPECNQGRLPPSHWLVTTPHQIPRSRGNKQHVPAISCPRHPNITRCHRFPG